MGPARPVLVAVMGPTASGKTALAEAVAETLGAQLLNADAFQVYRYLDIGTAKPRERDRYRLLDLVDPDEPFGVGAWVRHALVELHSLWDEGRSAVVVGGTGLYVRALFEEYAQMSASPDPELREQLLVVERTEGVDSLRRQLRRLSPEAFATIDASNPLRVRRALERVHSTSPHIVVTLPPFARVKVGVVTDRDSLGTRIEARVDAMLQAGWEREVRDLRTNGYTDKAPGMRAIGYREVGGLVSGTLGVQEAKEAIVRATRRYAKRQQTWMRSEPHLRPIGFDMAGARVACALDWISEAARS